MPTRLPTPIDHGSISAGPPFVPLALMNCNMVFDRPITRLGATFTEQTENFRVLSHEDDVLFVRFAHLAPAALTKHRFVGRFALVEGTYVLTDVKPDTEITEDAAPPWSGLLAHVQAARLFEREGDVNRRASELAALVKSGEAPTWVLHELGVAQAADKSTAAAIKNLSASIDDPGPRLAEALSQRALLRMTTRDHSGAEADVEALSKLDGTKLHVAFLRAKLAVLQGNAALALELLPAVVKDEADYTLECEPFYTRDESGAVLSADLDAIARCGETPDRAYDRTNRGYAARRILVDLLVAQGQFDKALETLEPLGALKSGNDSMRRGQIFAGLDRPDEARRAFDEARERGVVAATQAIMELQTSKALKRPTVQTGTVGDELDVDDRMVHKKFGVGTVLDVEGTGVDAKVTIAFDQGPTRTLKAVFLERV